MERGRVSEISRQQLLLLAETAELEMTIRGGAGWEAGHQLGVEQIECWNVWIAENVKPWRELASSLRFQVVLESHWKPQLSVSRRLTR